MSKGFRQYSTLASGSAVALLAALAIAPAAYAQEQVTSFNIPEQPLSTALLDLGRQAHISVAAPHEVVAGRTARPVQGDLSARHARWLGLALRFRELDRRADHRRPPVRKRRGGRR
jgi:hypothetical protein